MLCLPEEENKGTRDKEQKANKTKWEESRETAKELRMRAAGMARTGPLQKSKLIPGVGQRWQGCLQAASWETKLCASWNPAQLGLRKREFYGFLVFLTDETAMQSLPLTHSYLVI